MEHGFTWASILVKMITGEWHQHPPQGYFSWDILYAPLAQSVLVAVVLLMMALACKKELAAAGGGIVPEEGLNLRNFFEILMSAMLGFMEEIIGPNYRTYIPLVCSLWIFILFSNFLGLVPFFTPPTDTFANTFGLAIIVFVATHYYGVKAHGIGYLKHFISPVWPPNFILWIVSPLYLVIELIGHIARVVSLSIRLMANMFADHTVIAIFLMLTAPMIPSLFVGMGVIVCTLQAFIFAMLTIIYIGLATAHEEHEEHGDH